MKNYKKYKLIKSYPGSPKLGAVLRQQNNNQFYSQIDNNDIFRSNKEIENYPEYKRKEPTNKRTNHVNELIKLAKSKL